MSTLNQLQGTKVFYESVRRILYALRLSAALPIEGLLNPDSGKTRCVVKSLCAIIFGIIFFLKLISLVFVYGEQFRLKTFQQESTGILSITTTIMILSSLACLCKNWGPCVTKIESLETEIPPLPNHKMIVKYINWFFGIMIFITFVEHFTYVSYTICLVRHCLLLEDDSGWYLRSYFLSCHGSYYKIIPFNYFSGFLLFAFKLQTPIISSLADTLIVAVTIYLSHRFKNFYKIMMETIKNRGRSHIKWCELQAHYTRLTMLVMTADELISPFIFSAFLSHLLLICKQIYDIIQKERITHVLDSTKCVVRHSGDAITITYLFMSLFLLLLRSLSVSLLTAHLHTLSRESLNALHSAPTPVYNHEMQKLMDQVYNTKIGLSGLRFFYVTRSTVLSMISTILTYELVLIQIDPYESKYKIK